MNAETRHLPATYAAVVFSGKNFEPQLVSAIIGKSPTLSYAYGSKYLIKDVIKTRKISLWVYSTRNKLESDQIDDHLDVIEELLIGSKSTRPNTRIEKIKELIRMQQVKLRVDVFWYGATLSELPKIRRSFEDVVTMAGGSVATDFHRDGDEEEAA